MKAKVETSIQFRERKLDEMRAYRDELAALRPVGTGVHIDTLRIPPGTLCVVNALAGEVWMAQGSPQRRWLVDAEDDAKLATEP